MIIIIITIISLLIIIITMITIIMITIIMIIILMMKIIIRQLIRITIIIIIMPNMPRGLGPLRARAHEEAGRVRSVVHAVLVW